MKAFLLSLVLLVFICLIGSSSGACPHSNSTLVKFSTVAQWNTSNAVVVIAANQSILLDKSPTFKLKSIEINGVFVIDNKNINISVDWIKVNAGGKFIAGSTDCHITNKVTITFHGNRTTANIIGTDPADYSPFGAKGMAVATGAYLELHGYNEGPSWTRLAATARINATSILLEEAVNWKAGDAIVLASTDFSQVVDTTTYPSTWASVSWARGSAYPEQTEELVVVSVNGNNVTFNKPLNFVHWGQGIERAEVGLLSRSIVFQGDDGSVDEEFGGHLIMRHGIQLHIEGVEFRRFGQKGVLARYPVHFHLLRDAIGKGFWIKHSSIHSNFQRCLVLHESHGILVQNLVGYKTNGHMFFLEDGGEVMNTIDHVLGINAKPVPKEEIKYGIQTQVIPTDNSPSIFWITNPNNTIINNAAVGGRFGYWFLMAKQVNGLAKLLYYQNSTYNPRIQDVGAFYNNVAHGSVDTGFELDGFMDEFGNTTDNGSYSPKYAFFNLTAYKCRQFGIWGKSTMVFHSINLLDNRRAFMVNGVTHFYDSYIVGESDNLGYPRKGHTRSFSDLNGANTTKICGHESYDNGGPQFSYNNVFVNFESSPTRKAGALCPLQTGPFMLDTENRLFNLTFINANRFHLGSPTSGDNEWGWTVLDIDGSATGVKGGGWIVSQNASHLLTPNCTYRPDWEAWFCPNFAEGYVQLTIVNQITKVRDTVSLNGTDLAPLPAGRIYRGAFYNQRNPSQFGRVLGAQLDCANGTADLCYQYMHNVIPRKFYTFRFTVGTEYVKTPAYVTVNMHSAMPGDYVYLSLPYPTTAYPFNITNANVPILPVTNLNNLTTSTYFYDSNTEHLYLLLKNTATSFSVKGRYNLTDYGSTTQTYHVRAACQECKPTLSKVQVVPTPATLLRKEETFLAKLENCQLIPTTKPSTGSGYAYFWFYPETRELHYNIIHDLTFIASELTLGVGKYKQSNYTLTTRPIKSAVSPSRGVFVLSLQQWAALVKGNIFVLLKTSQFPAGHLRGQIQCQGVCTLPPAVPTVDSCVPTGSSIYIFKDVPHVNMTYYVQTTYDNTTGYITPYSVCGNASVIANVRKGYVAFNIISGKRVVLDTNTYKFLEFYVKVSYGYGEIPLAVYLVNDSASVKSATVRTQNLYVPSNYLLDEYSGWQRVRIPVSDFLLPVAFNLTRVAFALYDTTIFEEFYLDEVRFVSGGSEPTGPLATAAEIKYFNPSICTTNG